ncbi:2-aminoethylphosphonate--pyruvate transaminase [Pseudoduganella namucuonensis]|uniref:2-aminoethylphosphonate--pyruvate transaminase n=1 Tax=Pseudoduganella namucuonensis TaxID=1035707 RepID=A0A1I7LCA7_9BURK|nr:2-aminoethylphosphonate--pyruvate transaminase [Pseudoduganella namucuonensis]SFV07351.1 2-aminoethylphosphonate--pyruvate transaminase [Pseudoduganella namucuonensis]
MLLLIPGPVTTASEVKQAFAQDYAPWDPEFRSMTSELRSRLLHIAGGNASSHSALALQGCGHFAVEAALRTFVPATGSILIPDTGDYADHMIRLAREAGRKVTTFTVGENQSLDPRQVEMALRADPEITHVGLVYCETGSGICHDVLAAGEVVRALGRRTIVDAISAFGALPLNVSEMPEADAVIFTSNKCLEGLPGLSFIIVQNERILAAAGNAGSWSLDLADVYLHGLSKPKGTWRFTPVPQAVAALMKALDLYEAEGGRTARLQRYQANQQRFCTGVKNLGLIPYLPPRLQGPICVNVQAPDSPAWDLQRFVSALKDRGVIISNFYNTSRPSFRVGCIGAVTPEDMERAVKAIAMALDDIGIAYPESIN